MRVHEELSYTSKYRTSEVKKGIDILVGDNFGYSMRLFIEFSSPQKKSSVLGKEVFFWGGESIKCEFRYR
jgi:hypothetical protein